MVCLPVFMNGNFIPSFLSLFMLHSHLPIHDNWNSVYLFYMQMMNTEFKKVLPASHKKLIGLLLLLSVIVQLIRVCL